MAQRDLTYKDRAFYIESVPGSGDYDTVICITSVNGNRTTASSSTPTFCGTKQSQGSKSITFDIAGTNVLNPDGVAPAAQVSINELIDLWNNDVKFKFAYGSIGAVTGEDVSENDWVETGTAFFTNVNDTTPAEGNLTFTANLSVDMTTYAHTKVSPTT